MSARVQSSFKEPTDIGLWSKATGFSVSCDHGRQACAALPSRQVCPRGACIVFTGQGAPRHLHPESWLWETAEGRQ